MIDYASIAAKLDADNVAGYVGLAGNIRAVVDNAAHALPAVFVIPSDEPATPARNTVEPRSVVNAQIAILSLVYDDYQALGGDVSNLTAQRDKVIQSMQGFVPAGADTGLAFVGGNFEMLANGIIYYTDTFVTKYRT